MKSIWTCSILIILPFAFNPTSRIPYSTSKLPVAQNLFIITTDGFRWQELFNGADSVLLHDNRFTPGMEVIKALYWSADPEERRKKLMPFFWNVIGKEGQIYGNRLLGNKVNSMNQYSISYSGYNEIFTGEADPFISSNQKLPNPNINVLEFLNEQPAFSNKIAVFSSWDVFPFIFNKKRNGLIMNCGYESTSGLSREAQLINDVQDSLVCERSSTRFDELTFFTAKEYIKSSHPRVVYLALGETDEFAHEGRYDLYLEQANKVDRMIAELWHFVQTTDGYKNSTCFLITTDHGRGNRKRNWTSHGGFINGSSQTWFAVMGPGIEPVGEIKQEQQIYQQQLARTIAQLLGEDFNLASTPVAPIPTDQNKPRSDF